jgi:hypothetical protein
VKDWLPDLMSAVTMSVIFSDSMSAYMVSFFSDFMHVFKNDTTSADFGSV